MSDVIGNEYLKWRKRDIIKIHAQTGTGKTYFIKKCLIPNIEGYETLLYVCNRTNLKRQLKKDLLEQFGFSVPYLKNDDGEYIFDNKGNKILDIDLLDKTTTIGNITITSYHAIQDSILDSKYGLGDYDLEYDYIIMDECHYILADGAFNNKCRLAFDELIKNNSYNSIKIFISATMDELQYPISKMLEGLLGKKPTLWDYTTGIDYSYVDIKYFTYIQDIITTIRNDRTDNKWLIFVSDLEDAKEIKNIVGEDKCSIIKAGDKTDELKNIIANSKFDCKVLITTKAMDNGINFSDDKLTNIVIMAWDKITFIQMLGRKRVDIDNAQKINLYIPTRLKKSFLTKLRNYKHKREKIDLLKNDINLFNRQNDNDLKKIAKMEDLFYRDHKTGEWALNKVGNYRLWKDTENFEKIKSEFDIFGKFTFVLKQLEWMDLIDTFDEGINYIENVRFDDEVIALEEFLEKMFIDKSVLLKAENRKELIEKINLIDGRHSSTKENIVRYVKNIKTLNSQLKHTLKLNYQIKEFETSRVINNEKKKFKKAWKIIKLVD